MTLGRIVSRGLIPLSVFALLGSGLALHDPMVEVGASVRSEDVAGTPAVVRDTEVESVEPADQAQADPEALPKSEAPESRVAPDEEVAPESGEPETLAEPETDEGADEGHGEEGHIHDDLAGGVVVAELEPRELESFALLGVTWSSGLEGAGNRVEARWRSNGTWSDWTELHVEPSTEGIPGTEPQWVGEADAAAVRVISTTGAQPQDVELSTIDPGQVPDVAPAAFSAASTSGASKPRIISRASWGARSNGGCDSPRYGKSTRGAVIHHTAGTNSYSKSQSAQIVKGVQAYHVGSQKWCDIGYNFLVDKYGQIFEGRAGGIDKGVRAAHSGNGTVNQETIGISMMGAYSTTAPTEATKKAVDDLTAWKFTLHGIPAKGTFTSGGVRLNRISGHRNVVGTACPGQAAYAWVADSSNGMRDQVARRIKVAPAIKAPGSVKMTGAARTSVSLDWASVSGATKYEIQASRSSSMSSPSSRTVTSSSGTFSGLRPSSSNQLYYLRVRVVGPRVGAWSPAVSGRVSTAVSKAPAAPSGVKVTGAGARSVSLDWANVSGAKKYELQASRKSSMSDPGVRSFTSSSGTYSGLNPVSSNQSYYFRVRVVEPSKGAWSAKVAGRVSSTPANSINNRTLGSARSVTLKGHGYGHGIGMSQYGARGGALQGKRASQILATYYPGTTIEKRVRDIRVLVSADNDGSTAVVSQSGLRFQRGSTNIALPTTVSGQTVRYWRIDPNPSNRQQSVLQYQTDSTRKPYKAMVWSGDGDFVAPTIKLALPGGKTTVTYRDRIRAARPDTTSTVRRSVNVLDLDDYTRGVVAREVPASWPSEALRSQAIAARSYGLRSIKSGGYYDICDTTSCQVYGGVGAEDSRTDAAVASTADMVLMYRGQVALTQFSSSSGGFTNAGSEPYLKAVADPWDGASGNPNHDWSQSVSVSAIQQRYPAIGTLRSVTVTKRNGHGDMGGRVTSLKLTGSKGSTTISGPVARFAFGLKSDWFGF